MVYRFTDCNPYLEPRVIWLVFERTTVVIFCAKEVYSFEFCCFTKTVLVEHTHSSHRNHISIFFLIKMLI